MKPTPELNRGARIERAATLKIFDGYAAQLKFYLDSATEARDRAAAALAPIQVSLRAIERTLGYIRTSLKGRAKRTAKRRGGVGRR